MLLNEIEIAQQIGKPLTDLSKLAQKRKVRKLIRDSGKIPHVFYIEKREIWCIPKDEVVELIQCQTNLKSLKKPTPRTGTFVAPSMVRKSTKAQEYLTKA